MHSITIYYFSVSILELPKLPCVIKSNSFEQQQLSQLFHCINKDVLIENGFSWIKLMPATNGMNLIKIYNDISVCISR